MNYLEQVKKMVSQYENENQVINAVNMLKFLHELEVFTEGVAREITDENAMEIMKEYLKVYNYLDDYLVKFFDNSNEEVNNMLYRVIEVALLVVNKDLHQLIYDEMIKMACKENSGFGSYIITDLYLWFNQDREVAKELLDLVKAGKLTNKESLTELAETFLTSKDLTSFLILVEYYGVDISIIDKYLTGPDSNSYPEGDIKLLELIVANYAGCPEIYREKLRQAKRHNQDLATFLN